MGINQAGSCRKSISVITETEEETEMLGKRLGINLFGGAFVALRGELGAGKTAFARGIAAGLDISGVASPTFTIIMEHTGKYKLFHFDVYRLSTSEELSDIGFDDYLAQNGVIIMEWPENVEDILPAQRLEVTISKVDEGREFRFTPLGKAYHSIVDKLNVGD